MTDRYSPDIKEALHYLSAIKVRLELLYEHSTQDARLLEHLSDEVDWVDAEIERLRSTDAAATPICPFCDEKEMCHDCQEYWHRKEGRK